MFLPTPSDVDELNRLLAPFWDEISRLGEAWKDERDPAEREKLVAQQRKQMNEIRRRTREFNRRKTGQPIEVEHPKTDFSAHIVRRARRMIQRQVQDPHAHVLGLPLLVPPVPIDRLPDDKEASRATKSWARRAASHWRVFDPELKTMLSRVADERGVTPVEIKEEAMIMGLIMAWGERDEPTSIRIGSGEGSGKVRDANGDVVELIPANLSTLQELTWLGPRVLEMAKRVVRDWSAELEDSVPWTLRPDEEVDWPKQAESEELREFGERDWMSAEPIIPDPLDSLEAEESTRRAVRDLIDSQRRQETRKVLEVLFRGLESGSEIQKAIEDAASELGLDPRSVRRTLSRLGEREDPPLKW